MGGPRLTGLNASRQSREFFGSMRKSGTRTVNYDGYVVQPYDSMLSVDTESGDRTLQLPRAGANDGMTLTIYADSAGAVKFEGSGDDDVSGLTVAGNSGLTIRSIGTKWITGG